MITPGTILDIGGVRYQCVALDAAGNAQCVPITGSGLVTATRQFYSPGGPSDQPVPTSQTAAPAQRDPYEFAAAMTMAIESMARAVKLGEDMIFVVHRDEQAIADAQRDSVREAALRKRDTDIETLRQASVSVWHFGTEFVLAAFSLLELAPDFARQEVLRHRDAWLGLERAGVELNNIAGERAGKAFEDYRSYRKSLLQYMERFGEGLAALAQEAQKNLPTASEAIGIGAVLIGLLAAFALVKR